MTATEECPGQTDILTEVGFSWFAHAHRIAAAALGAGLSVDAAVLDLERGVWNTTGSREALDEVHEGAAAAVTEAAAREPRLSGPVRPVERLTPLPASIAPSPAMPPRHKASQRSA